MANTNSGAPALSFTFSTQALRVIMRGEEPWFVAADVCEALSIAQTASAMRQLDDDEKGVHSTHTPGGQQEMTIINESGLYSLILTSRKPEAKRFKKWVTAEVLPTIRKTGRYVAPSPRPEAEKLSGTDLAHIKRMVWHAAHGMRFDGVWTQAIWFYLRQALALPYPGAFTVEHLPAIASETQRIVSATEQVHALVQHIESEAARRIFRKGECADLVLAELQAQAQARLLRLNTELRELPTWMQRDLQALQQRLPHAYSGHNERAEQVGFFNKGAA